MTPPCWQHFSLMLVNECGWPARDPFKAETLLLASPIPPPPPPPATPPSPATAYIGPNFTPLSHLFLCCKYPTAKLYCFEEKHFSMII